jgi:PKD repeat protein
MTKIAFIHIQDPETLPVALWVSDKDTIYIGDSIQFSSLSSVNSLFHKWNFVQGSPMNSEETNPIVTYNKKGSFTVALTVRNNAGSNSYIVNKAITVFEKTAPLASFTSDKTIILPGDSIVFVDKSTGSKNVKWYFSGGEPSTSTSRSPIIRYPEQGAFPVKMVVNNDFGTDSLTIESYVSVGTSGTSNELLLSDVRLFPNPSGNNSGSVTLAFSNFKTGIYKIDLFTNSGQFIKSLYADKIKSGENELSFRTNMLSAGSYFISLSSDAKVIKTLPLLILE